MNEIRELETIWEKKIKLEPYLRSLLALCLKSNKEVALKLDAASHAYSTT
jgi:hypothetical protein